MPSSFTLPLSYAAPGVTAWGGHVDVARDQPLTNTVCVSQVRGLGDTTAGDHVRINDLILSVPLSFRSLVSDSSILLRERNWLCERHNQRERQCGRCYGRVSHRDGIAEGMELDTCPQYFFPFA